MPQVPHIPGYTIERLIACGGTADVYLAQQDSLGRDVALKILKNQQHDLNFTRRFIKEGKIIAALKHPHIVTIYDIAVTDSGHQYIAMEYINGGDLEQHMDGKKLIPDEALAKLKVLAATLQFIHEKNIVHRDIKPANVLIDQDGALLLTDFGIAKLLEDDVKLTKTGTTVGSPAYSSPEQVQGLAIDTRSDIYSLGILFMEMLMGKNPYQTGVYATTSINHIQMPTPKLLGPLKPYQYLLNRMLAKKPEDRFDDMQQLLNTIDNPPNALLLSLKEAKNKLLKTAKPMLAGAAVVLVLGGFFGWQQLQLSKQTLALLTTAEQRLAKKQRVHPAGDSALYYFNQVLSLDGGNDEAIDGKQQLLSYYLGRGETAYKKNRLMKPIRANARFYFEQALLVAADNQQALKGIEKLEPRYLQLAKKAPAATQLMRPKGDNALYFYTQALSINKNSVAADKGIKSLVDSYLTLAELAIKANKILTPKGQSAIDYYQRALQIDKHSKAAQKGIASLATHYYKLALGARQKRKLRTMEIYVDRGLTVDPYNIQLIKLKSEVAKLSKR